MKKRLIFEVEEGDTSCNDKCPFFTLTDFGEVCGNKNDVFDCCDYDISTLKFIGEYEENSEVRG